MAVNTGTVIRFDEAKGYGFIALNGGGEDVFVHANEITDRGLRITAGTEVEFQIIEGDRGLKAYDVRIVGEQPAPDRPIQASDSPGSHNGGAAAEPAPQARPVAPATPFAEEELLEVFSESEFLQQVTELLLATAPQLTSAGILEVRSALVQFARKNGWVE